RHDAVAGGEVMLGDPGGVVAQPLGLDHFVGRARMHVAGGIRFFLGVRWRWEKDADFHVSSRFLVVCDPRTAAMRSPAIDPTLRKGTVGEIAGGSPWHSTSSSRTA